MKTLTVRTEICSTWLLFEIDPQLSEIGSTGYWSIVVVKYLDS